MVCGGCLCYRTHHHSAQGVRFPLRLFVFEGLIVPFNLEKRRR